MSGMRYWIETEGAGHYFFYALPFCLLFLLILFKRKRKHYIIPAILITTIIVNPWFYEKWEKVGLYAYWRVLWIVPVVPIIATLPAAMYEKIKEYKKGKKNNIVGVVGIGITPAVFILVIGMSGTYLYKGPRADFIESNNAAKIPQEVVEIADWVLENKDNPRIIAQDPIGVYIRQYSGNIDTLFGRDIQGYIISSSADARLINLEINDNDSDLNYINQFMLDNDYDYLVILERNVPVLGIELIKQVGSYQIYRATGQPAVVKERNKLGQVISEIYVDENGKIRNNTNGYAIIDREYDDYGYISKELYTDKNGNKVKDVNGASGFIRIHDAYGNIIRESCLDSEGKPYVGKLGYAEVRREFDKNGVIRETYYDVNGHLVKNIAGFAVMTQKYDRKGNPTIREYFDENNNTTSRKDGISKVIWSEKSEFRYIQLFNKENEEVNLEGINLTTDIIMDPNGWTEWYVPEINVENCCIAIGTVILGDKKVGDKYTCQGEIEFKNVSVIPGKTFRFFTQGIVDKHRWDVGNVWGGIPFGELNSAPEDGIYHFVYTSTLDEEMAKAETFEIGFRCDNWMSGRFRIGNVKIEIGEVESDWTPGL